jgi:hypothetical protein
MVKFESGWPLISRTISNILNIHDRINFSEQSIVFGPTDKYVQEEIWTI